ncbi:class II fumarate hydratase [Kozakia baliensis]|uniref:Fumarate hydratase class II n=1 Tax=Kozakia baliensis TaxID=153496 RepID=A0A1D8USC1_9PROT|nr:class II fumarate hydratase [Kozakia baliensis]AOX16555.1 class II fumarate hydratase [Kozakia baliensis]GBR24703.1 fumarate hydratase [Kozakia baliensis NRIC 0488]GEL65218.1 fumarate hydratase class II 2 [Kozakia baliensis]
MTEMRIETDGMGEIEVPADKLWGAQTQRSLHYFSIGKELMPREMIESMTIIKRASAEANFQSGRLGETQHKLILQAADEILKGEHADMFPLHVWMTGSGTQFNMNVNEVIANRSSQLAGEKLGSKKPVHPNDHVNMSQSSNDAFPTGMYIAAALGVERHALPALRRLAKALADKAEEWKDIVKIGRTHMQDATPMTLGQEFHGYAGLIHENISRLEAARDGLYSLALGGTAIGTGINTDEHFAKRAAGEIARLTGLPFISGENKFALQGSHDALVHLSGTLRTIANALYKIANDIRLLGCGPRAGFAELHLPENEPGSSIMPGKVNPTQAEALSMLAIQIMANDVAVGFGGASGLLEMNVYKPLMIHNIMQSITLIHDGSDNFRKFMLEGAKPNLKRIERYVNESVMLVTALAPKIGYDLASKVAHYAMDHDTTLRDAALELNAVSAEDFDKFVDPRTMIGPNIKAK